MAEHDENVETPSETGEDVRTPFRTILPSEEHKPGGVNILRVVKDNAIHEITELDDEISKLEAKLQELVERREYVRKLNDIAEEYHGQ